MPIYPIKGSTSSAIQAINAGNATVSHRVARVNGFDGTANHLIYTAIPDALYTPGNPQTEITGGWVLDTGMWPCEFYETGSSMYMRGAGSGPGVSGSDNTTGGAIVRTSWLVDLSDMNTLAFTANGTNVAGAAMFAISPNVVRYITASNNGSEFTRALVASSGIESFNGTYYFNVSDLTGAYYVYCIAVSNGYIDGWYSTMYVTNIACS